MMDTSRAVRRAAEHKSDPQRVIRQPLFKPLKYIIRNKQTRAICYTDVSWNEALALVSANRHLEYIPQA